MGKNQYETRFLDVPTASCIRLVMDLLRIEGLTQAEYVLLEKLLAEKKTVKAVLFLDHQEFYFRMSFGVTK